MDFARAAYEWSDSALSLAPTPVGAFPLGHTPEGIWDLCGNVFEWCSSWKRSPNDVDVGKEDPPPTASGEMVYRGGSVMRDKVALRAARRGDMAPAAQYFAIGFRVVCRVGATGVLEQKPDAGPPERRREPPRRRQSNPRPKRKGR